MEHALALAGKGVGLASPNPTVGCVIVRDGQIAGEGFHQYDWRDHAEIVALKSAGEKARGATLYVTLEPCNHTERTGPCTEAIISAGIQRVVAAIRNIAELHQVRIPADPLAMRIDDPRGLCMAKLADRGSWQSIGLVTDVESFLRELAQVIDTDAHG